MSSNQLPSDQAALRVAVRQSANALADFAPNKEVFVRSVEIIAVEARRAGIRAAMALIEQTRLQPSQGTKIFQSSPITLYVNGYDHAVGDVMELLAQEAVGD